MNRRAKLSLASSQDIPKKQAPPGFEGIEAQPETARTRADPSAEQPPPRATGAQAGTKREPGVAPRARAAAAPPAFQPRQLLKVAIVLVATALSLYLLKRRLF